MCHGRSRPLNIDVDLGHKPGVHERLVTTFQGFLRDNNGDMTCAKMFILRDLTATPVVKGFGTSGGVVEALMIMLSVENPVDVTNMFLLVKVACC